MVLDDKTQYWLNNTIALITPLPASDSGSAAAWGSKRINLWPQSCLCLTCSGYPSNDNEYFNVAFQIKASLVIFFCLNKKF